MAVMMTESMPVALRLEPGAFCHPVVDFFDRSIRRERRLEALLRRAARGPFGEEAAERLRFEAYEDREHARILRRHRTDVVRGLRILARAPGARVAKVGRTVTPENALREALALRARARDDYRAMAPHVEDRFARRFVEVLARAQEEGIARLREIAGSIGVDPRPYSTRRVPAADRPQGPSGSRLSAVAAGAA